jgi:hypothetical protein
VGSTLEMSAAGLRSELLPVCLLATGAVAFYFPLLFLGRVLVDYDALVYFAPQRAYLAESLTRGAVPLWNPYLFVGAPFVANPQSAVLYPPSWLFLMGPVEVVYSVQLALHAFLAALWMYLFARLSLRASPLAAGIGALSYACAGLTVQEGGHLNQISAAAWLPAVILGYDQAVQRRSLRWAAFGGVALALQILAGHPQITYITAVALVLFGLIRHSSLNPRQLVWPAVTGIIIAGLGFLLSAAQVLPMLELKQLSIRAAGVPWGEAIGISLTPPTLLRVLLPPLWLRPDSVGFETTDYLGYIGTVPLCLGLSALVVRSRLTIFGAALCVLGITLALGPNTPWYGWLFGALPGFDSFRVPARWLLLWTFGGAILAVLGASSVDRAARTWPSIVRVGRHIVLVAVIIGAGLALWVTRDWELPAARTALTCLALAALTLAVTGLARRVHGGPARRWALAALVAMTAVELYAAADPFPARQAPRLSDVPQFGAAIRRLATEAATAVRAGDTARLLSLADGGYTADELGAVRSRMTGEPEWVIRSVAEATGWRAALVANLPLQVGLRATDGYDGGVLPLHRFLQLVSLLAPAEQVRADGILASTLSTPPERRLLDLLGVQFILTNPIDDWLPPPGWERLDLPDTNVKLYADRAPVPFALLEYSASVADDSAALSQLARQDFDPDRQLVVAPGPGVEPLSSSRPAEAVPADDTQPEHWSARVRVPERAYLLQREAWYPGWRARVDGRDVPVLRADILFRAVLLEPGVHDVEVFFDSQAFDRGVALTIAGLAITVGLLCWPLLRHTRGL